MGTTQASEPTVLSRVGGFFDEVGKAFSNGWANLKNGDFRKMDWKQGLAMGATLAIGYVVVKSIFEMLWEFVNENKFIMALIGLALAAIAIFSLMGGSKGQQRADADMRRDPRQPERQQVGMLDDGVDPAIKRVVMHHVDRTQLAMIDPQIAETLNLDAVKLAADHLPKQVVEADLAAEARRAQAMIG